MQSINTMFLRVIGIITLFGFTLFLTHKYDPKIVGQYDFIRTFLLVVGSLCLLGTDQSILYFGGLINGKGTISDLKKVYFKKLNLILFTSLIPFLILLTLGENFINNFFNDKSIYLIMLKSTIILFFYCMTILNTETFRVLNKVYTAELFRNTFKYVSVIIGAIFLFHYKHQQYLVDTYLIGFVFLAIISFQMILSEFKRQRKAEITTLLDISHKEIFLKSYPMAISGMAFFLLMSFDIMFLKKYFGNAQVAYYSTAIKLMTILSMVIISVNITASTKIAEFYASKDFESLKSTVKKTARLIFLLTFPIAITISLFAKNILYFFGHEYIIASNALVILMMGQAFCSMFGSAPIYLNMTGRQGLFQYILIVAVIINFIANSFLIPIYGMIGASISFVISSLFWNITSALMIYLKDKVKVIIH